MDGAALYEEDIYAWSQHQAAVLRQMAAMDPAALPNDLDLQHVAEEIEDVGNEQRYAVESSLVQLFAHLIRLVALPDDSAVRHWTKEANAFLDTAESRYRPSMRRVLDPDRLWSRACRLATRDLTTDGHAAPPVPEQCPFSLEELVSGEADPRNLATRLAEAAAARSEGP